MMDGAEAGVHEAQIYLHIHAVALHFGHAHAHQLIAVALIKFGGERMSENLTHL